MGGRGGISGLAGSSSVFSVADSSTQSFHASAVSRLSSSSIPDGTYDISTMKAVEYNRGYQVTFCQIGDNYTPEEYAGKVNEFLNHSSDGRTSAGKFGGTPEVSFHVSNRRTAIRLAKKYNQVSVWDWKDCNEIITGGTGRRD